MKIEILGTESLGVRGLCCMVSTEGKKILIDPGIALGYTRYKLLPHPFQVAVDERIQKKIINAWAKATDIVISHFHGDHVPLASPNPYQLDIKNLAALNPKAKIWVKSDQFSPLEKKRMASFSLFLDNNMISSEQKWEGVLCFSKPVPHGKASGLETVMMSKIEEDFVFVHASDIQLLNDEAISQIISWKPDIVLASGPPLYLYKLSRDDVKKAWYNAIRLSRHVDTLILDHHLMRSYEGARWLDNLSSKTARKIMCGADFMKKPRMLLEAQRPKLYKEMSVPGDWHEACALGKANTDYYWNLAQKLYFNGNFYEK